MQPSAVAPLAIQLALPEALGSVSVYTTNIGALDCWQQWVFMSRVKPVKQPGMDQCWSGTGGIT